MEIGDCMEEGYVNPAFEPTDSNGQIQSTSDAATIERLHWDTVQQTPTKTTIEDLLSDTWEKTEKIIKIFFGVFLFVLTLSSVVITRIVFHVEIWKLQSSVDSSLGNLMGLINVSFHNRTACNGIQNGEDCLRSVDVHVIWSLFCIIVVPYVVTVIYNLCNMDFGNLQKMNIRYLITSLIAETLHSCGLTVLVFGVLPLFDPFTACVVCMSFTVVPVFGNRDCSTTMKDLVPKSLSVLFVVGGITLTIVYIFKSADNYQIIIPLYVVTSILISVSFWENFFTNSKRQVTEHKQIKPVQSEMCVVYSWKSVFTLSALLVVVAVQCEENSNSCIDSIFFKRNASLFKTFDGSKAYLASVPKNHFCTINEEFLLTAVCLILGFFSYWLSSVACRTSFQRWIFSSSNALSLLITPLILFNLLHSDTLPVFMCPAYLSEIIISPSWSVPLDFGYICGAAVSFLLATLIVSRHVWKSDGDRLQSLSECFLGPVYTAMFPDSSMLLNLHYKEKKEDYCPEKEAEKSPVMPVIYMCATMWHETEEEMTQIVKSIFRADLDEWSHLKAAHNKNIKVNAKDAYKFQAQIFFDDAFQPGKCESVNLFVKQFVRVVNTVSSDLFTKPLDSPLSIKTPYGGQILWTLPCGNSLVVHLKNKDKIRHRKRWSQVMYMYYILGYMYARKCKDDEEFRNKRLAALSNTYILALDGDTDFMPSALQLLLDRMKKDPAVGAACGRIHPIGNGPMVWYQKFEYAASHWLQKATEHVIGSVFCSPGCFSLMRASALRESGVMAAYTQLPTEPQHYLQYDQGEDRWLCTLLLKKGYKVEYCAASDAFTYAPEGFYEFYKQRRRWIPSTMANILDLLKDSKSLTQKSTVSSLYIFYQMCLFASAILTPGTIFLLILGAFITAFPDIEPWKALIVNLIPVAIVMIACFVAKDDTQLLIASTFSLIYSIAMVVVLVGLLKESVEAGLCSVTTWFLSFVIGVFLVSAILHPKEFPCLLHGVLYFLCVPSISMLLILYSLGNLHVISWGTRENPSSVHQKKASQKRNGFINVCGKFLRYFRGVDLNSTKEESEMDTETAVKATLSEESETENAKSSTSVFWQDDADLKLGKRKELSSAEQKFWNELIAKYLKPLENDEKKQKQTKQELLDLRNKACLFFFVVNTLFVTLVYTLTQVNAYRGSLQVILPCTSKSGISASIEPISVTFTIVFGILLLVQFLCMLLHQFDTLCHIVATTEINGKQKVGDLARDIKECILQGTRIYVEKRKRQQGLQVYPTDETDFNIKNVYKDGLKSLIPKNNQDEVDAHDVSTLTKYRRKRKYLNLLPDCEQRMEYVSFSPPNPSYENDSVDPSVTSLKNVIMESENL